MEIRIQYASSELIPSFYDALSSVARERIYIEMVEAPPFEKVQKFQQDHISKNGPVYYAVENGTVVGWCDVFPFDNPRQNHRGGLGMGLLPEYRGRGIGSQLLSAVLRHCTQFGLEKVELHVYTSADPPQLSQQTQRYHISYPTLFLPLARRKYHLWKGMVSANPLKFRILFSCLYQRQQRDLGAPCLPLKLTDFKFFITHYFSMRLFG